MKDRAELKEAVKTRAALESYQDSVYLRLMKQLNSKQVLAKKFKGDICPKIKKKLAVNKEMSYNYQAKFVGS